MNKKFFKTQWDKNYFIWIRRNTTIRNIAISIKLNNIKPLNSHGLEWMSYTLSSSPILFRRINASGWVTYFINGQRYASLLKNKILPDLQAYQCLSSTIFMQDGAPPHINILKRHFTQECIISRYFPDPWPPRSPDTSPCNFGLWGNSNLVSLDNHELHLILEIAFLNMRISFPWPYCGQLWIVPSYLSIW